MNGGSLLQIRTIFPENIAARNFIFFPSSGKRARLSIVSQKFARTFLTSLNRDSRLDRYINWWKTYALFWKSLHRTETRVFLYIKLEMLFIYVYRCCSIIMYLLAITYCLGVAHRVLIYVLSIETRFLIETLDKGCVRSIEALVLIRNCSRVLRILEKKIRLSRVHYIRPALVCSHCQ